MRSLVFVQLICWLGFVAPATAQSQSSTQSSSVLSSATDSQAKPQPAPAPAPAPASTVLDTTRSLFDQTWRQFELGGRFSNIDGDPARFQRYGDFRDGLLFTDARFATEDPDGTWGFRAMADKVGWRDQRYAADYERTGRFVISGFWDEIPQFYSVDTATPYTTSGDALVLDDATQRRIQNAQANLPAYIPIAPQFELREPAATANSRAVRGSPGSCRSDSGTTTTATAVHHQCGVAATAPSAADRRGVGQCLFDQSESGVASGH